MVCIYCFGEVIKVQKKKIKLNTPCFFVFFFAFLPPFNLIVEKTLARTGKRL